MLVDTQPPQLPDHRPDRSRKDLSRLRPGAESLPRGLLRLLGEYAAARLDGSYLERLRALAKIDLLVLDDWGVTPLTDDNRRDLLEILDDRYDRKSTLVTSQIPVDGWHAYLADPTLADAILDRLVHNGQRLILTGESIRRVKAAFADQNKSESPDRNVTFTGGISDVPEA
jgi:hypothetical protein